MKPNQLARLLGVSPVTLREWSRDVFTEFLSPSAQGDKGAHRSYADIDARILAWVAQMKQTNARTEDIISTLRSAHASNWRDLPPLPGGMIDGEPVSMMPREAAEARLRAIQDEYEQKLTQISAEKARIEGQLKEARQELKISYEASAQLQSRLMELSVKEAELRGELKQYVISGKRFSAFALAATALAIGIVLTLVILTILLLLTHH